MKMLNIKFPSVKQIYNWINANKWTIKNKYRLRRYCKKSRKRVIGVFGKIRTKKGLPIWFSTQKIDNKLEYGHWELDLVLGKRAKGFANLLVLTDLKSRFNVIAKIYSKNSYKFIELFK